MASSRLAWPLRSTRWTRANRGGARSTSYYVSLFYASLHAYHATFDLLVVKINATVSRTSGFSPFRLVFGQDPPSLMKPAALPAADGIAAADGDDGLTDLEHGAAGMFCSLVGKQFTDQKAVLQRVGVSGSSLNCAFLAVQTAVNAPLAEGKDAVFTDLDTDAQIALSLASRRRLAKELTQNALDLAFGVGEDAASVPSLDTIRQRLNAAGDVDEHALLLLAARDRINIFVARLLVEDDGDSSQMVTTAEFLGGFQPQRRTIGLYNRMRCTVEKVLDFADLDDDNWSERKVVSTSGHFEVIAETSGISSWDADSAITRV